MPDITINDSLAATADVKIRDDAPLAKSGLGSLSFAAIPLIGELDKPVDQCSFKSATFGLKLTNPAEIAVQTAFAGALGLINSSQETLFDGDPFAPRIPIAPGEAWVRFELDTSVTGKFTVPANGFGVGFQGITKVGLSTYTLLTASSGTLPSLRDAIKAALENYSVTKDAAAIRSQRTGTVNSSELSGAVTLTGSYSLPISVAPLASANLPFNHSLTVRPETTLELAAQISITGDFIFRCHKVSKTEAHLGLYKKRGTTLSVTLIAESGIEAGTGQRDLIGTFFGAVLPGIDVEKAGLTGEDARNIQGALKSSLDHSLSIALNAACTASRADESAIVYSIDLAQGDKNQTDSALASALAGDWTLLDALPNARPLRNILKQTHESGNRIAINLLGVYNAGTLADFVRSCTVLHDENGQIAVLDRIEAKRVAVAGTPYTADTERLRSALAECFLATFTYTAGSRIEGTLRQNYARYKAAMPALEMRHQILLARALNLLGDGDWDRILASQAATFDHVRFSIVCEYDLDGIMRVFFPDPPTRLPFIRSVLEETGRKTKAALLDPDEPSGRARLAALNSDAIWTELNKTGNTAAFGSIAELKTYNQPEIQAIAADWIDITWWADAMAKVAPKLSDVLAALQASNQPDPTADQNLMKKREALAEVLGAVARRSQSAFGDGWGLAVLFRLSAGAPHVSLDYAWGGTARHVESGKGLEPMRMAGT
ncbi:MAG TPA: hypothetical protein VH601_10175 [Bryobacteraceae bacterium]|jgi:hypothetical protein